MAKNEKMVKDITAMDEDFAKWYTDIVKKAELIEYTSVKGCMVIRPYGYAIWENMQRILDTMLGFFITLTCALDNFLGKQAQLSPFLIDSNWTSMYPGFLTPGLETEVTLPFTVEPAG